MPTHDATRRGEGRPGDGLRRTRRDHLPGLGRQRDVRGDLRRGDPDRPGCDHASLLVRETIATSLSARAIGSRSTSMISNGAPATARASMRSRKKPPRSTPDLTTPSQWPKLAASPGRRDAGARGHGISAPGRQTQRRRAQPVQRHRQHVRRRVRRAGGGAGVVRQRGHQRHRQGRRRRHPATRTAQQPRDRQGGRHADDAARDDRGGGVRAAAAPLAEPEHQAG